MIPAALLELDLNAPLQDDELATLDDLLLDLGDRTDGVRGDQADVIRDVAELDGFLLAVASSPLPLEPEQWLPAVWGGQMPAFLSEEEAAEVIALLLRHHNAMVRLLARMPDAYEPLFAYDADEEGNEFESVEEWCVGFLRGMELAWEGWLPAMEREADPFAILQLFGTNEGWEEQESYPEAELAELQESLPEVARLLVALGLEQRAATPTFRREEPKVGRNDACPCGSGKKFKQCCGA